MENRLEILRSEMDKLIFASSLPRKYFPHLYCVSHFCTLLALRRKLNVELATTCGMLLGCNPTKLDPIGKPEYVQVCSEHMKHRFSDDYYCWVAEDNGLIVSHIHIIITRKLPKPGNLNSFYGRLSQVRTIPEYRNQGIGI